MTFLNVVEIESALTALAAKYPDQTRLLAPVFPTSEGRTSHALQIGRSTRCPRSAVLIVGGVHPRERGGPDSCIYFAADLLEAYDLKTGLTYGGTSYTADEIRRIVERIHVIVFPNANPDGLHYAQSGNSLWRKNRNPANGGQPNHGVDVNRNFNFLWDAHETFAPGAHSAGTLGSKDPTSYQFRGRAPFSEAESCNVRWLFEQFPHIRRFVDVHSYWGVIIHPWGDDDNQSHSPAMNFTDPAWNGQRGLPDQGYSEYINRCDHAALSLIATAMSNAIAGVRGVRYLVGQAFRLPEWIFPSYAASGTSTDWAYSRHLTNAGDRKVLSFGIEFNHNRGQSFLVPWMDMERIIPEIDAALVRLCLTAIPRISVPGWICRVLDWRNLLSPGRLARRRPRNAYGFWGRVRHVAGNLLYPLTGPFRRLP